jgi:hypothetical protein
MKTKDVEPHSSDVAARMILSDQMQCTFLVSVQGIGSDKHSTTNILCCANGSSQDAEVQTSCNTAVQMRIAAQDVFAIFKPLGAFAGGR